MKRSYIQRTEFKRKHCDAAQNHMLSRARSKAALRAGGRLKAGKRSKAWAATRARLKAKHEATGIKECELRYDGCKRDDWLSFAHGRKRRHLVGNELETLTIVACTPCHAAIERLPEAEMCAIVETVIANRKVAA